MFFRIPYVGEEMVIEMKKKIVIERALDQEITTFDELFEMLKRSGIDTVMLELALRSHKEADVRWLEALKSEMPLYQIDSIGRDRAYYRGMVAGAIFQLLAVGLLTEKEVQRLIKNI